MRVDTVRQLRLWQSGVAHELEFWRSIVAARGAQFADDFAYRLDPDGGMDGRIGALIRTAPVAEAVILDVGSGPLTKIGKVFVGARPRIVATDPLAAFYREILAAHGVTPPVRVETAFAEDLSCSFPSQTFDVTVCINALDHAFDPVRALHEMLDVTKIGGALFLQHHVDEAEHEGYIGLHQWNFTARDGRFVIWNRATEIDVTSALITCAEVERVAVEDDILTVEIRRTGYPGCESRDRQRARVVELLSAFAVLSGGAAAQ